MKKTFLFLFLLLSAQLLLARDYNNVSLSKALTEIEKEANGSIIINFAPDDIKGYRTTCCTDSLTPLQAIRKAIGAYPIKVTTHDKYVTLQSYRNQAQGRLLDEDGQPVEFATITCISHIDPSKTITTNADEKGFWSCELPLVGKYSASISCLGYNPLIATISSGGNPDIQLSKLVTRLNPININDSLTVNLAEIVVNGDAVKNLRRSQMGVASITSSQLLKMPSMLGEPDVIKALQQQPGVSQGVEAFTGLYVHGGENDQNLFLYDGLPLYHVSHLGGLFSGFNAAAIHKLDFYKSSFPAAYGGYVSSITDIKSSAPDFQQFHGRLSLGLISGNAYVTGPIIKEKTAFAVALRRTWLDVVSAPALAIINAINKKDGKKKILNYAFTDFNLRLDHKFNDKTTAKLIGYYGHDNFRLGNRDFQAKESDYEYYDESVNKMSWGNYGALLSLRHNAGKAQLLAEAYTSNYDSRYCQDHDWQDDMQKPSTYGYNNSKTANAIHDLGARFTFDTHVGNIWKINGGISFAYHRYMPENIENEHLDERGMWLKNNNPATVHANEEAAFIDNVVSPGDFIELSAGLRYTRFATSAQSHNSLEPRASARFQLGKNFSIKASYAKITQYAQQIANNYITLPTDLWQPTAAYFKPLESKQYSAGFYGNLPWSMYFSAEGWYKKMSNLAEYREGVSAINASLAWQDKLTIGRGWAYGADLSITKHSGKVTGSISYGLMWNWRKFDNLNGGEKFPAKFDNRHKINISASYQLKPNIDITASWVYLTGNRITLSLYNYQAAASAFPWAPGWAAHDNHTYLGEQTLLEGLNYFSGINNVKLPSYNRLDLGINFHRQHKNGRKSMWSVSIYNAYCRMNPITIKKDGEAAYANDALTQVGYKKEFRTLSLLPVIPSVTYTYIF